MKLPVARLFPPSHPVYYLYGEDRDTIFDTAERLLLEGADDSVLRLRVDASELERIEVETRSQGLFGASHSFAMVRNAESATPKESERLLALAERLLTDSAGHRLVICAPEMSYKKALHKDLQAMDIVVCECASPTLEQFGRRLHELLAETGLKVSREAESMLSERLVGMWGAARQAVDRMRLYDNGEGAQLESDVVAELLGERSPEDLGAYCAAVASRSPQALSLLHRLLREQQLSEVQVLSWLSTRLQQLLMYLWFQADDPRGAMFKAKVFGDAKKTIASEAKQWTPQELMLASYRLLEAEMLLKGASIEDKPVVLERLTLDLIGKARLEAQYG